MRFANLGPARIPAHSGGIFLRDRTDGTVWLVTSNGEYVGITDAFHRVFSSVLDAYDVGDWRVFITGGRMGMERPIPAGAVYAPMHTHKLPPGRDIYVITAHEDRLAYEQVAP